MEKLQIEKKTNNMGINSAGKLKADEFNRVVNKINELIESTAKSMYLTQEEYDFLVKNNLIEEDMEYNIFEE